MCLAKLCRKNKLCKKFTVRNQHFLFWWSVLYNWLWPYIQPVEIDWMTFALQAVVVESHCSFLTKAS